MTSIFNVKLLLIMGMAVQLGSAPTTAAASSSSWSGEVSYVVDGDTVRVRPPDGGKPVSIRIEGIDAPEICQAGGASARDALKKRVLGKRVVVKSKARDDYGRLVARIFLNHQDQGQWMVSQGLAWSYHYRSQAGPYAVQERQAQSAGRGLFSKASAKAPMNPRDFRKKHGSCYVRARFGSFAPLGIPQAMNQQALA